MSSITAGIGIAAAVSFFSIPFWADGFDTDLIIEEVEKYKEETGNMVYRRENRNFSFIAISPEGDVFSLISSKMFSPELTINPMETVE